MKKSLLFIALILVQSFVFAQTKEVGPVKNVILMIPDGTSTSVVSAARWLQVYNGGAQSLNIDPYICGTVTTFSSNAPIGDSAPTMSCYMTGIPQQPSNISMYPVVDAKNDLFPLDSTMSYQPLMTILEAAKYAQDKAVGMVVTVEFPHATPASCFSHHHNRWKYEVLAPQIAYNNLDLLFGGGSQFVTDEMKQHLTNTNTLYLENDIKKFRDFQGDEKIWALFGEMELPYELDRNDSIVPSIAEMTRKAIDRLSKNENGFFLMVEGSLVDYLGHSNDAAGMMNEFLAFDKAVGVALDFAKKDGETAVVILPDHGNSGFSIGRKKMSVKYTKATLTDLFETPSRIQRTAYWLEKYLKEQEPSNIKREFEKYTEIELTDDEYNKLISSKNYEKAKSYMEVANSQNLHSSIIEIMNSRMSFGFTIGGHTGEEVFLAVYHPEGDVPMGRQMNTDINRYLADLINLEKPLAEITKEVFAKHTDVFAGLKYEIVGDKEKMPTLVVTKGKKKLEVQAFSSVVKLNDMYYPLNSVAVYIDKNNTFYLHEKLRTLLD